MKKRRCTGEEAESFTDPTYLSIDTKKTGQF